MLEDCAQCAGGRYKGKYVGTIGDIGINSFQLSKTITAGEGGAVITSDPKLFERAFRFHDFGTLHTPYTEALGGGLLGAFAACNFRMNEFTGAVLRGQLQKLETICQGLRGNARKVREAIADLPGLKLRKSPDFEGDLGVGVFLDLGNQERRDKFLRAMNAEGISASAPGGSVILPIAPRIEKKATVTPRLAFFPEPPRPGHPGLFVKDVCLNFLVAHPFSDPSSCRVQHGTGVFRTVRTKARYLKNRAMIHLPRNRAPDTHNATRFSVFIDSLEAEAMAGRSYDGGVAAQ